MTSSAAPQLEGDARAAVLHRGSHLQIIASAGSGKTEVVAQRFAQLMADGADPAGIIAFTFTERAADELKARISARVEERLGPASLDRVGAAFVGTIHSYCFRLLQQHVPRYETFDVLDERRLTAFLCREEPALHLKNLTGKVFTSIKAFLENLEVVENELIPLQDLDDPFKGMAEKFYELLEQFRLLTYGQLIFRAVAELEKPDVTASVHATLRHLIVDEYQDVNPAQERLIRRLTGPRVELCVVGDDDQAIYQWRGSDVRNIVEFAARYPGVRTFTITVNRRSRPHIVAAAASFAHSIPGRLDKQMSAHRPPAGTEVVTWAADTEADEADRIAETIKRLHAEGLPYRNIAVLVRTRPPTRGCSTPSTPTTCRCSRPGAPGCSRGPRRRCSASLTTGWSTTAGPPSPTPGARSPPTTRSSMVSATCTGWTTCRKSTCGNGCWPSRPVSPARPGRSALSPTSTSCSATSASRTGRPTTR